MADFKNSYKSIFKIFTIYWCAYGGFKSLFYSPFLHIAALLTIACWPQWYCETFESPWYELCFSIIPNLLGFAIGGYAILLAFGNDKFLSKLAGSSENNDSPDQKDNDPPKNKKKKQKFSPYLKTNATFLHFIFIQIVALIYSIISSIWVWETGVLAFIGFLLFMYSLLLSAAAALGVLRLARWFDLFVTIERENNTTENDD